MPGFSSCWYWNGGTLKTLVISVESLNSAIVASGGDMPTVSGSSLAKLLCPHCLAAAICSIIACTEILTAGSAILSLSVKSVMLLTLGLRVLSRNGCDENAAMPFTAFAVPCVRAQIVSRPGTPPETISMRSGQQRVVHCRRAVEGRPHDLHLGNPGRLGVFFEQAVPFHDVELQVAHRELAREAYLGHLRGRRRGKNRQHHPGQYRNRRQPSGSRSSYAHRIPPFILFGPLRRRDGRNPWSP